MLTCALVYRSSSGINRYEFPHSANCTEMYLSRLSKQFHQIKFCTSTLFPKASSKFVVVDPSELPKVNKQEDSLVLIFEDGKKRIFPFIFLRDNCQCAKCFHPSSKQRLFNTAFEVELDLKPKATWNDNGSVHLEWDDGHISSFSHKWLQDRTFPATNADITSKSSCGLTPIHWANNLQDKIPRYDFEELITHESTLLSWLESIATTGLTLIENAPVKPGVLSDKIVKNIGGYAKNTHYG